MEKEKSRIVLDPIIAKYIFEYRYPANPEFHQKGGTICKKMVDGNPEFNHWKMSFAQANIFNDNKRFFAFASSKRAGMHFDFPGEFDFITEIQRFTYTTQECLHPSGLTRLGSRLYLLYPLESFEFGQKIFSNKIYKEIGAPLKKLGEVYDYSSVFDFDTNNGKGHIQIGPMKREQLFSMFIKSIGDEKEMEKLSPPAFLFVDYDLSHVDISKKKMAGYITGFCRDAIKKSIDDTNQFMTNLGLED